jgi:heparan-alpha-glucosaminide N-acetyltransferase
MSHLPTPQPALPPPPQRLMSLDAFRGFVMLLMAIEIMEIPKVARTFGDHPLAQFIAFHLSHVEWTGCSLWDLIQPSFMFMVGVALPFSIAARQAKGERFLRSFLHTLWRAFLLICLGVFLRSVGRPETFFTFVDVLSQIGLGYPILFLLAYAKPRWQLSAAVAILVAYWALFALWPLPAGRFDYTSVGVKPEWAEQHQLEGFAAHWNKNTNPGHAFDVWFLNLFPAEKPFQFNSGGYQTLNFIPSLATMIFGLLAGGVLRSPRSGGAKFTLLVFWSAAFLAIGMVLDRLGVCPSVKRIWTPSWAVYSTGWTLLFLAGFYLVIDLANVRSWAFPLVVVGMNSIAMYCLVKLIRKFIASSFQTHLGQDVFLSAGERWEPILQGGTVLVVLWLILFWMFRRKIFLRL